MTATVHMILVVLPCFIAAYTDLKEMKIPNILSIVMVLGFVVTAPFLLTLDEIGWRVLYAGIAFAIGFALNAVGKMGGGDVKFGSASLLYVAPIDIGFYLQVLGLMALAGVLTHRFVRGIPAIRNIVGHWRSWGERANFPLGFVLAGSLLYYLSLVIFFQ
ncbi:MAG: prepilin peptidase [Pseudomonadota bacterium]